LDFAVFFVKGVAGGGGLIDQFGDFGFVLEGHFDPNVFEGIGDLTEEIVDGLEAIGQYLVYLVFY
jgi:hypothetical protein